MLFLAVAIKLGRLVSPNLEQGAFRNYQFFARLVTYPLLFAIGVSKTQHDAFCSGRDPYRRRNHRDHCTRSLREVRNIIKEVR
jgi:hypothetical protein